MLGSAPETVVEDKMAEPGETSPDLTALLAAIRNLAQGVERLQRSIDEQQPESESLSSAVERVVSRTEGMVGTVRALHDQSERTSAELDSLRAEQAALARALAEDEGRLAEVELQQQVVQEGFGRITALEQRIGAIESAGMGGRPPLQPPVAGGPSGDRQEDSGDQDSQLRRELEALLGRSTAERANQVGRLAGRPESAPVTPVSTTEVVRRLQRLERRDAAITDLIELMIERARLIAEQDSDRA
jgi:hypothetical protein